MDIEVIIKRTLVFTGLFTVVIATVASIIAFMQGVLGSYWNIDIRVSVAISGAIAILIYEPVKKLLINLTDKFLFQKKEDIRNVLRRLSQDVLVILDMRQLGKKVLATLADALRLETAAMLVMDEDRKGFRLLETHGVQSTREFYSKDEPFIQHLEEYRAVLNLEDPNHRAGLPVEVLDIFGALKAVVALPLYFEKTLIGILFLGKKKSDQEYSTEEINYFPVIASSIALALRNAIETKTKEAIQMQAAHQMKLATMGTLVSGMGHQLNNPINVLSGMLQLYEDYKARGFFAGMSREELLEFMDKILAGQSESIQRMKQITHTMRQYALKPKEVTREAVNLQDVLDQALYFIGGILKEQNIMVEKKYEAGPALVYVNRAAMDEVFLNIITNAMHAIGRDGKITVGIKNSQGKVDVFIRDTGHGISQENAEKLFIPFFTTKDTGPRAEENAVKGTGLGLFLVKLLVESNDGTISFESKEGGGGTTFYAAFPAYSPAPVS